MFICMNCDKTSGCGNGTNQQVDDVCCSKS